jgi:phage-related protein
LAGGVETLFKDSADVLMGYADKAYQTAGLSANEYMATVTSFSASLLQSLGGDTAKAADYADQAIIDMSDNANKMGTSMEMIQNAYQGFAKQNYTMLDNLKLGYGGTKEEMQRLLDDAEKLSGLEFDISSFADVTQAIHIVQTELGITGTTAKEASTTIQGSASAMKASWENLMVGLADENANFDQLLQNFIDSVGTFAGNLIPRIEIALGGVVDLIKGLVPKIAEALPSLVKNIIPMALDAVLSVVNALAETFPTLLVTLIQTIVDILPDLIPQLITGLVNMLVLLMTNFDQIILPIIDALPLIIESLIKALFANLPQIVAGLTSVIKSLVTSLPNILASLTEAIKTYFVSMWNGIKSIFANIGTWFRNKFADAWNKIKAVFSNVKQFFTSVWGNIKKVFTNTGKAIADAISGAVRSAINRVLSTATKIINGFIRGINVAIGVINAIPGVSIRKLSQISVPKLAEGAVLPPNKPLLAMVGDQKHGTNIEAPADLIRQMARDGMLEASAMMNNNGFTVRVESPIYLDSRQIALAVREAENNLGKQTVYGGFANAY